MGGGRDGGARRGGATAGAGSGRQECSVCPCRRRPQRGPHREVGRPHEPAGVRGERHHQRHTAATCGCAVGSPPRLQWRPPAPACRRPPVLGPGRTGALPSRSTPPSRAPPGGTALAPCRPPPRRRAGGVGARAAPPTTTAAVVSWSRRWAGGGGGGATRPAPPSSARWHAPRGRRPSPPAGPTVGRARRARHPPPGVGGKGQGRDTKDTRQPRRCRPSTRAQGQVWRPHTPLGIARKRRLPSAAAPHPPPPTSLLDAAPHMPGAPAPPRAETPRPSRPPRPAHTERAAHTPPQLRPHPAPPPFLTRKQPRVALPVGGAPLCRPVRCRRGPGGHWRRRDRRPHVRHGHRGAEAEVVPLPRNKWEGAPTSVRRESAEGEGSRRRHDGTGKNGARGAGNAGGGIHNRSALQKRQADVSATDTWRCEYWIAGVPKFAGPVDFKRGHQWCLDHPLSRGRRIDQWTVDLGQPDPVVTWIHFANSLADRNTVV